MQSFENTIIRIIHILMVTCMAVMLAMVFLNAALRYLLNSGITASEEISRWLFVWMTFLGAIVAIKRHMHLGVDIVIRLLPPWLQKICAGLSALLILFACYLLGSGAWKQTIINLGTDSPATGFPVAILYFTGVISSIGIAVYVLVDLYRLVTGRMQQTVLVASEGAQEAQEIVDKANQPSSDEKKP